MKDYERSVVLTDDEAAIIINSLAKALTHAALRARLTDATAEVRAITDILYKLAAAVPQVTGLYDEEANQRGARSMRIAENAFEDLPLVQGAQPKKTTYVRSESDEKKAYRVENIGKLYWCDCPAFRYLKGLDKNGQCKHIRKVREDQLYHGHSR